jgi:parallel beta-helix repeat protein
VTIAACYSGDSDYLPSNGSSTLTVVTSGPVYYSKDYSSVQAAINAATSGSNVIVAAGNYYESLILNKTLTIIGERDTPVFSGGGSGIFLTVTSNASGSNVTGFEITSYDEGILVYASNCKIYSNTMSSMGESGIVLDGSSATGDVVYDNAFQNTPTAINLTDSAADNTVYGNIISSQATVTLNVGTNDNSVYENAISGSSILLNMTGSTGNTFYHNDFLATVQIVAAGSNTWDKGYPSGGNYWSDYQTKYPNAAQIDSSGIWNTSYVIDSNNKDNYPLMNPYALATGHDVAVTIVVSPKVVIMQGYTGNVTVTVFNEGQYAENFTVTAYANSTVIGTKQVSNLASAGQITLTFIWNTTGLARGNYTISAYAQPVQGETDIADNNFTGGQVAVSMVGDLTGTTLFVPDGKVDGRDITEVARCFGSYIGCPPPLIYNVNCDIFNRGKIDGRDITIVAKNFGKHDP